jgi:hypothetical protein
MDKEGNEISFDDGITAAPATRVDKQDIPVGKEGTATPVGQEGNIIHFSEDIKVILIGIIILAIIVLFLMILSIAPLLSGAGQNATLQNSGGSGLSAADVPYPGDDLTVSPTPSLTPVIISSTPSPAVTQVQNRVVSYVTIEPRETADNRPLQDLHVGISKPNYDNLFSIYTLTDQEIGENFPYITYELKNPPLVLDYDVTLTNITDLKYYEYKIKANKYEVIKTNIRPSEDAYFHVTVRDRETGDVITDEGVGTVYGMQNPERIILHKAGNYLFEFTGRFARATLSIKVPREGNIV